MRIEKELFNILTKILQFTVESACNNYTLTTVYTENENSSNHISKVEMVYSNICEKWTVSVSLSMSPSDYMKYPSST
jgi:hypothetical protein